MSLHDAYFYYSQFLIITILLIYAAAASAGGSNEENFVIKNPDFSVDQVKQQSSSTSANQEQVSSSSSTNVELHSSSASSSAFNTASSETSFASSGSSSETSQSALQASVSVSSSSSSSASSQSSFATSASNASELFSVNIAEESGFEEKQLHNVNGVQIPILVPDTHVQSTSISEAQHSPVSIVDSDNDSNDNAFKVRLLLDEEEKQGGVSSQTSSFTNFSISAETNVQKQQLVSKTDFATYGQTNNQQQQASNTGSTSFTVAGNSNHDNGVTNKVNSGVISVKSSDVINSVNNDVIHAAFNHVIIHLQIIRSFRDFVMLIWNPSVAASRRLTMSSQQWNSGSGWITDNHVIELQGNGEPAQETDGNWEMVTEEIPESQEQDGINPRANAFGSAEQRTRGQQFPNGAQGSISIEEITSENNPIVLSTSYGPSAQGSPGGTVPEIPIRITVPQLPGSSGSKGHNLKPTGPTGSAQHPMNSGSDERAATGVAIPLTAAIDGQNRNPSSFGSEPRTATESTKGAGHNMMNSEPIGTPPSAPAVKKSNGSGVPDLPLDKSINTAGNGNQLRHVMTTSEPKPANQNAENARETPSTIAGTKPTTTASPLDRSAKVTLLRPLSEHRENSTSTISAPTKLTTLVNKNLPMRSTITPMGPTPMEPTPTKNAEALDKTSKYLPSTKLSTTVLSPSPTAPKALTTTDKPMIIKNIKPVLTISNGSAPAGPTGPTPMVPKISTTSEKPMIVKDIKPVLTISNGSAPAGPTGPTPMVPKISTTSEKPMIVKDIKPVLPVSNGSQPAGISNLKSNDTAPPKRYKKITRKLVPQYVKKMPPTTKQPQPIDKKPIKPEPVLVTTSIPKITRTPAPPDEMDAMDGPCYKERCLKPHAKQTLGDVFCDASNFGNHNSCLKSCKQPKARENMDIVADQAKKRVCGAPIHRNVPVNDLLDDE